jgi:hypothetical protein
MVPLTPAVDHAISQAKLVWPEAAKSQSAALQRLIAEGGLAAEKAYRKQLAAHRAAVAAFGEGFPVDYPDDYLERLRQEWPA